VRGASIRENVQIRSENFPGSRWRWIAPAAAALAGLGLLWWTHRQVDDPTRASRPFRIGFQNSPPDQYLTKEGGPAGPAIDIVAAAARRMRVPLVWVHAPDGPEPNLRSGKVDLWPLMGDLPERRKFLHITDPWVATSFWMVSLESAGLLSAKDTAGRLVTHGSVNLDVRMARANFPRARLVAFPISIDGLEAVCLGRADAALVPGSNAHGTILRNVTACADKQLRFTLLPNGQIGLGVAASRVRPGAGRAADAIREGIGAFAGDGRVSSI